MAGAPFAALEKLRASGRSAAMQLRVRSALNPMLWLCAIVSLPCFLMSYYFRDYPALSIPLEIFGGIPVVFTVVGFVYFMIKSPEKLQSEDYQIKHETLELIREKGSDIALLPSSLDSISNPAITPVTGDR